jgi:dipeptidase E
MGNEVKKLKSILPRNKKTALIMNAIDFSKDLERRKRGELENIKELTEVGLNVEVLDLRDYFHRREKLRKKMNEFGVFWVRGGNTFVLRQAMKLSGFDVILKDMSKRKDILYGGYSAGICVLSPTLKSIEIMDDPRARPYGKKSKVIWEGLGIVDYAIVPHYKSNHPESKLAGKAVEYLIENKVPFKALRDGEVIIMEKLT